MWLCCKLLRVESTFCQHVRVGAFCALVRVQDMCHTDKGGGHVVPRCLHRPVRWLQECTCAASVVGGQPRVPCSDCPAGCRPSCCAVLCCAVLCCAAPCCAVLCCATQRMDMFACSVISFMSCSSQATSLCCGRPCAQCSISNLMCCTLTYRHLCCTPAVGFAVPDMVCSGSFGQALVPALLA
jgi:hypothetical protein